MAPDITVRLANEGVPLRAIARAVQVPSAEVRERLQAARAHGYLIELPCEDWPAGYPRERRLLELARMAAHDQPTLQTAVRTIFGLAPREESILLLLLSNSDVARDRLQASSNSVSVNMCQLRQALAPFGLTIETLHGYGYRMSAAHRRQALDLILRRARHGAQGQPEAQPAGIKRARPAA